MDRKTDFPIPMFLVKLALRLTDFLDRHPRMVRTFLRPLANAPLLRNLFPVVIRAFMGATAFDCHQLDRDKGWVIFGDVKETIQPALFTRVVYENLSEKVGKEEAERAIRKIARESLYAEIKYGVEGKHVPWFIRPLVGRPGMLETIRSNPHLLRLAEKGVNMVIRLIGDEGGWGRIRVDLSRDPLRVTVENSLYARYFPPSGEPFCVEYPGLLEGCASYMTGEECEATEVECVSAGAPRCLFEVHRKGIAAPDHGSMGRG